MLKSPVLKRLCYKQGKGTLCKTGLSYWEDSAETRRQYGQRG
jgi:hypothetical protein